MKGLEGRNTELAQKNVMAVFSVRNNQTHHKTCINVRWFKDGILRSLLMHQAQRGFISLDLCEFYFVSFIFRWLMGRFTKTKLGQRAYSFCKNKVNNINNNNKSSIILSTRS